MKLHRLSLCLLLALAGGAAPPSSLAETRFDIGVSIVDGDVQGFYLGLGHYYGYTPHYVERLHVHHHLPYDDIPVVLYYADLLELDPLVVVRLRLRGWSWLSIGWHYHLSPAVFYYPVHFHRHHHHWHPIRYYYEYPRERWERLRLSDREVVELVNLRYVSEHYAYAPERVLEQRRLGRHYRDIAQVAHREGGSLRRSFDPRSVAGAPALREGAHSRERMAEGRSGRDEASWRDERREQESRLERRRDEERVMRERVMRERVMRERDEARRDSERRRDEERRMVQERQRDGARQQAQERQRDVERQFRAEERAREIRAERGGTLREPRFERQPPVRLERSERERRHEEAADLRERGHGRDQRH